MAIILEPDQMKEKQYQLDYCTYMIITSYFKKSSISNINWERRIYLSYSSMKNDKQIKMEEMVIKIIESHILKQLPKDIDQKEVKVILKNVNNQTAIHLYFDQHHYVLLANYVDYTRFRIDCKEITPHKEDTSIYTDKTSAKNMKSSKKDEWIQLC